MEINKELHWARRDIDEKVGELWALAENLMTERDNKIQELKIENMSLKDSIVDKNRHIQTLNLKISLLQEQLNAK